MVKAVISASYHYDSKGLQRLFTELETSGVRILSPISVNFIDTKQNFVAAQNDEDIPIAMLEEYHLRAIRAADILFVHAPDGYIGISTSFEIGYAKARHIPIVCTQQPTDVMMKTQICHVSSVFDALSHFDLLQR